MITRLFEALANHRNSDRPTRILGALFYLWSLGWGIHHAWSQEWILAGFWLTLVPLFVWMDSEKYRRGQS